MLFETVFQVAKFEAATITWIDHVVCSNNTMHRYHARIEKLYLYNLQSES